MDVVGTIVPLEASPIVGFFLNFRFGHNVTTSTRLDTYINPPPNVTMFGIHVAQPCFDAIPPLNYATVVGDSVNAGTYTDYPSNETEIGPFWKSKQEDDFKIFLQVKHRGSWVAKGNRSWTVRASAELLGGQLNGSVKTAAGASGPADDEPVFNPSIKEIKPTNF